MKSIEDMNALTEQQKIEMLTEARGGIYEKKWWPYCLQKVRPCNAGLKRMERMSFGFWCTKCGNIIGFDLERLQESPLNSK